MFTDLEATGRTDLMAIGGTIASLVFSRENPVELVWLNGRLQKMHDLLRESPFYQEILQKGRAEGLDKGLEKGLEEGLEQGRLAALRGTLLKVVRARFPKLVRLTKQVTAVVDDSETLEDLIVNLSTAQTSEKAQKYLLDADEDNDN